MGGELVHDLAVDGERVVEALVALDELLDGDGRARVDMRRRERLLELGRVVDAYGARGAGGVARLHDQRIADPLDELAHFVAARGAGRLRAGDAGRAQHLLHRRLVAAQERGLDRRAGDAARLAHARRGHDVRLDGRLETIDLGLALDAAHLFEQRRSSQTLPICS